MPPRSFVFSFILASTLTLLVGCPTKKPVEPTIDADASSDDEQEEAGRGTPLGTVCVVLRNAGCPEGLTLRPGRTCYAHLRDVSQNVKIPVGCLLDAGNAEAVRKCGATDPNALRFRCPITGAGDASR